MFDLLLYFILCFSYEIDFERLDIPWERRYEQATTAFSELYYMDSLMKTLSINNAHDIEHL